MMIASILLKLKFPNHENLLSNSSFNVNILSSMQVIHQNIVNHIDMGSQCVPLFPLCGSRKNPYPPQGGLLEIPRGRGFSKAKICKEKYDSRGMGRGFKPKILHGRGMDIFWNTLTPFVIN
jgi:hypothetical protein